MCTSVLSAAHALDGLPAPGLPLPLWAEGLHCNQAHRLKLPFQLSDLLLIVLLRLSIRHVLMLLAVLHREPCCCARWLFSLHEPPSSMKRAPSTQACHIKGTQRALDLRSKPSVCCCGSTCNTAPNTCILEYYHYDLHWILILFRRSQQCGMQ